MRGISLETTNKGSFISAYVKFFKKLTFRTCPYQGVRRNVIFSENFAHVLNKSSLVTKHTQQEDSEYGNNNKRNDNNKKFFIKCNDYISFQ